MQSSATPMLSWQSLHLTDTGTRGPAILGLFLVLLGLTTLLVGVRIYTRCRITHGFGSDDVLILMAYTMSTAFTAAGIAGEQDLQWGRHVWDVPPSSIVPGLKLTLAMQVLFDGATNLTKLSMLALFVRITLASGQYRARRMALCLSGIVTASAIVFLLVDVFQCRPVSAYWTLSASAQRHCINQTTHLLAAGVINTVADLVIAVVFPFQYWSAVDKAKAVSKEAPGSSGDDIFHGRTVTAKQPDSPWRRGHHRDRTGSNSSTSPMLSMSSTPLFGSGPVTTVTTVTTVTGCTLSRRRLSFQAAPPIVTSLFLGGLLVVAAGTARTVFTFQSMTSTDGDVTWNTTPALMASALELNTAIMVASFPALKPFFCRYLPDRYTSARSRISRVPLRWPDKHEKNEKLVEEPPANSFSFSSWRNSLFAARGQRQDTELPPPPPDLNKPLPTLLRGQGNDTTNLDAIVGLTRPRTYHSVYDFRADADGYIHVHKAPMPGVAF